MSLQNSEQPPNMFHFRQLLLSSIVFHSQLLFTDTYVCMYVAESFGS